MGSWSEACGFSGMEIAEGEVSYIMLLGKPKYGSGYRAGAYFEPFTTLIRGTYNDYGYLRIADDRAVLDVFNAQAGLDLKIGDDFSLEHLEGRPEAHRYWVHGSVVEWMPEIKQDFPYFSQRLGGYKSTKVKNIGGSTAMRLDEIRRAHQSMRDKYAEAVKRHAEDLELALLVSDHSFREIFGYSEDTLDYSARFQKSATEGEENIDGLIEAYRRNWLIEYAAQELRKRFVPTESAGPQHGGEIASRQFARFLLKAQTERAKRWDS